MTCTIRQATVGDLTALTSMGERFIEATSYRETVSVNPHQLLVLASKLIADPNSAIFVSEGDGRITGMLGFAVFQHHISGILTAGEIFWWVDKDERGGGLALFHKAEEWAQTFGAQHIQMIAPTERVERLYERLGFAPIERIYQRDVKPLISKDTARWPDPPLLASIQVIDNVLADPDAYRLAALSSNFEDVPDGEAIFPGIARHCPSSEVPDFIERCFPSLKCQLTFLRRGEAGQIEPHLIHSDLSMGQWSAILYLNQEPPEGDGTAFWQRRADGAVETTASTPDEYIEDAATWSNVGLWRSWYMAPAKFNRMIVFPSRLFHSRAQPNYGFGDQARLIQVAFGDFS